MDYSIYNSNKIKTKFPNKGIEVFNDTPINGIDYICFGVPTDSYFFATEIKPLYQMKFSVKKILSKNELNNYCFLSVNILEYQHGEEIPHIKNVVVEGLFFNIYPDAEFEAMGYWKDNFKSQETFVLTEHSEVLTGSTVAVYNFIKHILKGKRVSDKTVKRIMEVYDVKALDAIKKLDIGLTRIIKSSSKLAEIQNLFLDNFEQEQAFKYLIEHNISSYVAVKVLEKYQKLALVQIKKNPYCLLSFADIDLLTIDKIAKREGLLHNDENRVKACVMYFIQSKISQNGDIYVDKNELIGIDPAKKSPINKIVKKIGLYEEPLLNSDVSLAIDDLVLSSKLSIEQNIENPKKYCVYKSYYKTIEDFIVDKLLIINSSIPTHYVPTPSINAYISSVESSGIKLDILQKQAIEMALQNRLSILTGGPGTGKTQTIKIIVDTLMDSNPTADVQLCAPTGKASRRMSEVIGKPAETIHKKLNYTPFDSLSAEDLDVIDCDLLIIDETSMIDVDLFYKLLKNTSDTTNILLVGDYNQLPSVGPGLILRDIIDSKVIPTIQLQKIFRQSKDNDIIDVSKSILSNNPQEIIEKPIRKYFKYKQKNNNDEILDEIISATKNIVKKSIPILDFQVITPMNDGLLGTLGLNKALQEILNPPSALKNEIKISPTKIFRAGDKVIQTVNNYDLHVFNGSIGIISEINNMSRTIKVDYDGDEIEYKTENINELTLAYAITVHKSQGSEFDFVIMPVSANHAVINNRNLMYTALTRAKIQFLFVGTDVALTNAINKEETTSKKSQIKQKLTK